MDNAGGNENKDRECLQRKLLAAIETNEND